jgi:putative membrane protein
MAKPFLTEEAKKALREAAEGVEACCSAELVVAVRPRSGSYRDADLAAAILAGLAALTFLLFSPWPFRLVWFLIDPAVAGALAALACSRSSTLRRLLTSPAARRERVERAARATFVDRRIHATTGRTGILLYFSVLEREAEAVADLGVEPLTRTAGWRQAVGAIQEAVRRGATGVEIAPLVRALGAVLAPALVRRADDVDELADEVVE